MKSHPILITAFFALSTAVFAAPKTFTIVSNANTKSIGTIESKTAIETMVGKGEVTGTIQFDASKGTGGGTISIAVKGIDTGIPLRNEHMNSANWLDSEKYPTITFKATKVQKTGADAFKVTGSFSLHGVTKTITTDVGLKLAKASDQSRKLGFKGDVVQLTSTFNIKLSDYGITIKGAAVGKISDDVTISIAAVADSK